MCAVYGRQNLGAALASGTTTTNATNLRASVYDPMPSHGWAYRWSARIGAESGGTIQVRGHLYSLNSSGNPDSLLANTAQIAQSQAYTYSSTPYADIAGDLTSIVKLTSGRAYGVGFAATGSARHGQTASGALMYMRSTSGTGPYGPMNYESSSAQGLIDCYVLYDTNVAPSVPGALYPSGQISNQTPAFTGTFRDANETVNGRDNKAAERLNTFQIQLRQVGSSTLLWDATYGTPEDQKVARAFSTGYGGSGSLTPGTTYEWRGQVSDQCGAWSGWTGWTGFTINPGGSLSTPTGGGRRTSRTPATFPTTWTHIAGLGINAYNPQILQNGTVVRDFGTLSTGNTLAAGTTFDALGQLADWTGTGTPQLDWGTAYTLRIRGRDTGNVWSPFSGQLAFTTNYPPTTPALTAPASGAVSSSRPPLTFTMSDVDNTVATGLAASVRIKSGTGTVLFTRAATFVSGTTWQYQTTATDLAAYATYRWDAIGTDGVLTTAYSAERSFVYAEGPVVTFTSPDPGTVVTAPVMSFSYTVSDQVSRQTSVYRAGAVDPVFRYTPVVSATDKSGAVDFQGLANNAEYEITVTVTNTAGLTGESPRLPVRLQYAQPPAITGFMASPELAAGDREPSVVRLTWNPSTLTSGFSRYVVFRDSPDDPTDLVQVHIASITSISQTTFIDPDPRSGVRYSYTIVQEQAIGVSAVGSLPAYAVNVRVDFHAVIISDAVDPSRRVVLRYVNAPERATVDDRALLSPWSGGPPVELGGGAESQTIRATYPLIEDPEREYAAIQNLRGLRADLTPALLVYRTGRGDGAGLRMTGTIRNLSARDFRNKIEAQLTFQEVRS